ncbi:hypothetical protein VTO42DRAFT_8315 [Malbranchea cinnamomea]
MASENPGMIVNGNTPATSSKSPAELLKEKHERQALAATVEEAVDEEDLRHPPPSSVSKAPISSQSESKPSSSGAPKPEPQAAKSATAKPPVLDVRSEELFPALGGGPKQTAPVSTAWGARKSGLDNGARTASSAPGGSFGPPKVMSMPGKHTEQIRFAPSQMLPRNQLKKPIADIVRDIDKKSKARLDVRAGPNGSYIFEGVGSVDAVRQALKEVAQQVGSKQTVRVPVPASARPHIIGRQGAVVQGIHERTGARIQVPRPDDSQLVEDDDDNTIDVVIEGDAVSAEMARREIEQIVKERASNINIRLKTIPPEFFPFIAGPHDSRINELEERTKTQIRVPRYDTWSRRPPPQEAAFGQIQFVPDPDKHIHIFGERTAVQEARAEIERLAQELKHQITLRQLAINRGQHQFILGEKGDSLHDFLRETGCAIILPPPSEDTEFLTITGPPDRIENGINRAMDLATSMQMASIDLSRQHPSAPAGPHVHARALTAYLQQRQVIRQLERLYDAHIVLPLPSSQGPVTWEVYSRDGKNTIRARSDIVNLVQAHPPSRLVTVPVDRYYHQYLRSRSEQLLLNNFGVKLVIPDGVQDDQVVLVYEGQRINTTDDAAFEIPKRPPTSDEIATFQKVLKEAQESLLSTLGDQSDIVEQPVPIPSKYHEKLQKFVAREQGNKGEDYIPVLVTLSPEQASLRGRSRDVQQLASKIRDFADEQARDELERNNITTFDFPQKFAHFLIGRKGENINKLRDEFDVDIKIENGKVEIKGPKAKAEAAKARITALAKKLEDETTYVLKIAPQYHRDLIGQRGSTVNRLQERYNVRVQFPRASSSLAVDDVSAVDTASDVGSNRNTRTVQASDEVIIRGPRKGADSARDEILSLYQWLVDHSHTASVSVARSQIPSLIGQRGREMDKLRVETGAQIDVPGPEEPADEAGRVEIKLKGTKKQVEDAKKLLLQRSKEFDETVTRTINVDKKHHKALIGAGGANIRKIVVEAGGPDARMVKFPRADSDDTTIRLEGREDIVNAVIAAIEEFVRQKEDQIVATIDVPQSQHRVLIGRGGDARRQIESQFNVILDVPKQGSGRTDVKVKGPSSAVEEAKAHILSLMKEQHAETVLVPRHLHHSIAENGAFFRRLRNDHQVTVDHAGEQVPPRPSPTDSRNVVNGANTSLPLITDDPAAAMDSYLWKVVDSNPAEPSGTIPWVITGTQENVAKAKATVEKAITTASQQSATGYLILPDPKTYRFVVGPGGSQINAIRKRTNCRIQVPKDQARGEAIEIKGSRDNLELAKDLILEAVKAGASGIAGRS